MRFKWRTGVGSCCLTLLSLDNEAEDSQTLITLELLHCYNGLGAYAAYQLK